MHLKKKSTKLCCGFIVWLNTSFYEGIQERQLTIEIWEWINQVALGKETIFSLQCVSCSRRKDHCLVSRLGKPSGRYPGVMAGSP